MVNQELYHPVMHKKLKGTHRSISDMKHSGLFYEKSHVADNTAERNVLHQETKDEAV